MFYYWYSVYDSNNTLMGAFIAHPKYAFEVSYQSGFRLINMGLMGRG